MGPCPLMPRWMVMRRVVVVWGYGDGSVLRWLMYNEAQTKQRLVSDVATEYQLAHVPYKSAAALLSSTSSCSLPCVTASDSLSPPTIAVHLFRATPAKASRPSECTNGVCPLRAGRYTAVLTTPSSSIFRCPLERGIHMTTLCSKVGRWIHCFNPLDHVEQPRPLTGAVRSGSRSGSPSSNMRLRVKEARDDDDEWRESWNCDG